MPGNGVVERLVLWRQPQIIEPMGNQARHVAVIMDGNGRWAQSRGCDRLVGHAQGVEALSEVVRAATDAPQVEYLTVYAFSTENWGRPEPEVEGLMELLATTILKKVGPLAQAGVRLCFIGNPDGLPVALQRTMQEAQQVELKEGQRLQLNVALNYGAREDLVRAVQKLVDQGVTRIDQAAIESRLSTVGLPEVDLLIRTSGECRLSNFLLWEASYAELYFSEVLWPDFGAEEFEKALEWFAVRNRRFGLVQ